MTTAKQLGNAHARKRCDEHQIENMFNEWTIFGLRLILSRRIPNHSHRTLLQVGTNYSWKGRGFHCNERVSAFSSDPQPACLDSVQVGDRYYARDSMTNVTPTLLSKVGRDLHHIPQHPLHIIKQRIVSHFQKHYTARNGTPIFAHFDNINPVVTTEQNFDSLLVPPDHVSRSRSDNYYVNSSHILRAHTSAHQRDLIRMGSDRFLVTGDVYRRDEIDSTHYPVFHQMEGVRLFNRHELFAVANYPGELSLFERDPELRVETADKQAVHTTDAMKLTELDLKHTLTDLVRQLFGTKIETRWETVYFPFTHPSFELEIKFDGKWLEVLGCGVMRQSILDNAGAKDKVGWAFGLGLDRLAMLLFQIPDIRLLWSNDSRFLNQFHSVTLDPKTNVHFKPFSKYPSCYKDISFWLPADNTYVENDFFELVRSISGDLVESVELRDRFVHPHTGRVSHTYRIMYCSMERQVTNTEINVLQEALRDSVTEKLGIELR